MTEPGKEQVKRLNITVLSGTGTGTISNQWDVCRRVRVIPPNETDTYDLSIKDADGDLIVYRQGQLGTFSELQEVSLGIASTVVIANGTSDGQYKIKWDLH